MKQNDKLILGFVYLRAKAVCGKGMKKWECESEFRGMCRGR